MAKKRNRNHKSASQPRSAAPTADSAAPAARPETAEIHAAHKEAVAAASPADHAAITDDPRPPETDLDALWNIVREARDLFRSAAQGHTQAQKQQYQERNRELVTRAEQLAAQDRELAPRRQRSSDGRAGRTPRC